MGQSESLRERKEQHKPKNIKSKLDDKAIYVSMNKVITYLNERFNMLESFSNYEIVFEKTIKVEDMINFIKLNGVREEFDYSYIDREIVPDGGVLFLINKENGVKKPILISEIKRQGTNDERLKEGKKKQATGNAIERLGKNLIGIKTMMNYEKITPFVCFGWGCDFAENSITVLAKIGMMNEFYPLNHIYVFKRDGNLENKAFSPVSMFFREEIWSVDEMFNIMKEIAETSLRYYLY